MVRNMVKQLVVSNIEPKLYEKFNRIRKRLQRKNDITYTSDMVLAYLLDLDETDQERKRRKAKNEI